MKKHVIQLLVLFLGCVSVIACSTQVNYIEQDEEQNTLNFGIVDFRKVSEDLLDKLTTDVYLRSEFAGEQPRLLVLPMKNRTDEYIDARAINQAIRVKLSRSRMFTFVNRENIDVLADELGLAQTGIANTNTTVRLGQVAGAQYALVSEISSIRSFVNQHRQQISYRVTMVLIDIETGVEIWIEESELSKVAGSRVF